MSSSLSAPVRRAREQIAQRRDEIRQAHAAGARSLEVVTWLAALADSVVVGLVRDALAGLGPQASADFSSRVTLVALGGYGRLELAPFSDIDLLLLHHSSARGLARELCEQLVRDFWDAGLVLGSSLRTPAECVALARNDVSVHTALMEARLVYGSPDLADGLTRQLARLTGGARCNAFIDAVRAARAQEQAKFGSAVHLLQPDVKKSKGGLRELHVVRWVARARYGVAGLDDVGRVALSAHDVATLRQAQEFLLRVRNDLHFHYGKAQDEFTLNDQVRVAAHLGYRDQPGMLPVEQFMQQYYRHGDALAEVAERFVSSCRRRPALWRRVLQPLRARRVGDYVVADGVIAPAPGHDSAALGSLDGMVQLFAAARAHGAALAPRVLDQMRLSLASLETPDAAGACRIFLEMLRRPGRLEASLQAMHAVGVLERLIPEFAHARGLIQFNQYHKYAVDEHTLLCVAHAEALAGQPGPLGQVYDEIHHKEMLHLALLIHDLGKGFDIDHSEVGRTIALREAQRFGLAPKLADMLVFLVHQHLALSNLAFRRDTSDAHVLAEFAAKVGTPEVLKMLYVFTAVDIQAVGPEAWTTWKADILYEVYARTLEMLTGEVVGADAQRQAYDVRQQLSALLADVPADVLVRHLDAMSRQDLLAAPPAELAAQLRAIAALARGEVLTTAGYDAASGICRYTIYAHDEVTPGIFSKITGVLAAKGLNILSARITTHSDGAVVDRFEVLDPQFAGKPPPAREQEVAQAIRGVLLGKQGVASLFTRRYVVETASLTSTTHLPSTKVEIDNDTSERYTIIEVFARDRQGLLYGIARTLFELGLSVAVAKITTSVDQVLDVFYVTDQAGGKIVDEVRLRKIREALTRAIDAFDSAGGTSA